MGLENNPAAGRRPVPASDQDAQPGVPELLPLQDYFVRVRAVAEEIARICAKTTEPNAPLPEAGNPLELFRTSSQILANGALGFHICDINFGTTTLCRVELVTPIGAISCYRPKDTISDEAFREITERFGLTPHPVEPKYYSLGRDAAGSPLHQDLRLNSPGDYMNASECDTYWRFFQS